MQSSENGERGLYLGRLMTNQNLFGEKLEEVNPTVFTKKCMIYVYLPMYVEMLGLEDEDAPFRIPLRGSKMIASLRTLIAQMLHSDSVPNKPGTGHYGKDGVKIGQYHKESEMVNLTVMYSGDQQFAICV